MLVEARRLLDRPDARDVWLRGAVWLTRMAVERAVRTAWGRKYPGSRVRGMRNQLLALAKVVDPQTRRAATVLWNDLSKAGHHHDHELTPTVAEIEDWHRAAVVLVDQLLQPRPAARL
ncbi:hypothetical protein [Pseudonocardia sp. HH130630-07]|uniref:hypothetical protein n=1 Tax=Pseudonocardia sp. HH130630-07 TaxID=1690815 RepID=UPI0012EAD83D|nr:hypothetical protein [Pseudonocardia sp. HH130630-07]